MSSVPNSGKNKFLILKLIGALTVVIIVLVAGWAAYMSSTGPHTEAVKTSAVTSPNAQEPSVQLPSGSTQIENHKTDVRFDSKLKDANLYLHGSKELLTEKVVRVGFREGKMTFLTAPDAVMVWTCEGQELTRNRVISKDGIMSLNFGEVAKIECKILVPRGVVLETAAAAGQIEFVDPQFAIRANIEKGDIDFTPAADVKYLYKISGQPPAQPNEFVSTNDAKSLPISLTVGAGHIRNLSKEKSLK